MSVSTLERLEAFCALLKGSDLSESEQDRLREILSDAAALVTQAVEKRFNIFAKRQDDAA